MKEILTKEESEKLFDLGISQEHASVNDIEDAEKYGWKYHRLFSITDLLQLLPNRICHKYDVCYLSIDRNVYGIYFAGYKYDTFDSSCFVSDCEHSGDELIDVLYNVLLWVIEIKKD